jgi:hypothetical protein
LIRYVSGLLFLGARPGSRRLGLSRRDWVNLGGARFTSLFDAAVNAGRPYHLDQSLPPGLVASAGNPYRGAAGAGAPPTKCLES